MALTPAQKQLRADIKRANERLKTLARAGVTSPAAERALTALGGAQNFNLGAKPSAMRELIVKQAVKKFLTAKTSTVKGYKKVQEKRRAGAIRALRDMGVSASEENINKALKGAQTFAKIAEMFNISTDRVQTYFAEGAEMGADAQEIELRIMNDFEKSEMGNFDTEDIDD